MCDRLKESIKYILTNNLELYRTIKKEESLLPITPFTRIQLIIMYIKLNIKDLKYIDIEKKEELINILQTNNYLIEDFNIITEDNVISFEELEIIVNKIYEYQQNKKIKIINFNQLYESSSNKSSTSKSIDFKPRYKPTSPKINFRKGFTITGKNIKDLSKLKNSTKVYINGILTKFINVPAEKITFEESKIMYFLTEIFILDYLDIPYELLNLPRKEISEMVLSDSNEYIKKLNLKLDSITQMINILISRKNFYEKKFREPKTNLIKKIDEELKKLSNEQLLTGIELQELRTSNAVYNQQIINIIYNALINWNISIMQPKDRIKLEFVTFNNIVLDNDIIIYLDGLIKLIYPEQLLSLLEENKLTLKNRSI